MRHRRRAGSPQPRRRLRARASVPRTACSPRRGGPPARRRGQARSRRRPRWTPRSPVAPTPRARAGRRTGGRARSRAEHTFAVAATDRRETESGIEVKPVYTAEDAAAALEPPGEFPYTRGPYRDMYRGRPWTVRQYAGFASAEESNARYRYLLDHGQTGLSIAFDLPTQLGYDSDDERALGEVGRTGVAIDSIADMELLLDGIPLDKVSTSMTINAPAALLLLLYELVAEQQGVGPAALRGTVQNDILKEYIA